MRRLLTLCLLLLAVPQVVLAGAAEDKEYTIAMVLWRGITDAERGFMSYLDNEGIRINYIIKDCEKDPSRLPGFITEIKALKPDLVYTFGTTVTRSLVGTLDDRNDDRHLLTSPLVFNIVADPVGANITAMLASSNSNFTGVSHTVPLATQLNVMRKVKPLQKLAVLYNPQERNSNLTVVALQALADAGNFSLIKAPLAIDGKGQPLAGSIARRISRLAPLNPDFLYLPPDSYLIANAEQVVAAANQHSMLSFSATEGPIRKAGALMGIVSTYSSVGKFAGYKAKQILLRGSPPASLPIETLKHFSLLVNISTAKQINFFPPVSLLAVAEVVE